MATLPTNLQDDILDASVNQRRRYRMINNPDETVEFEDVTVYSQVGNEYGAGLINETNRQVNEKLDSTKIVRDLKTISAMTQTGFVPDALALKDVNDSLGGIRFGYDSLSGKYGYWKKEADTEVFVPFSSGEYSIFPISSVYTTTDTYSIAIVIGMRVSGTAPVMRYNGIEIGKEGTNTNGNVTAVWAIIENVNVGDTFNASTNGVVILCK